MNLEPQQLKNGVFIVIEGADGSGKGTQFKLLADKLRQQGHDVELFDFPQYDQPSSHFVRAYLNGVFGPANSINPYTASLFYALDRYEAAPKIRKAMLEGKIVISNRYVGSNMAHQGAKFEEEGQQRGFFLWEDGLEYQLLGIPRPTINIYLRVPADISYELISKKAERSYTKNARDEHEADITHLRKAAETYDTLTELFPKDFKAIDCVENGELLSVEQISKMVWNSVKQFLPGIKYKTPMKSSNATSRETQRLVNHPGNTSKEENIPIKVAKISLLAVSAFERFIDTGLPVIDKGFDYHLPENISDNTATYYTDVMEKLKNNYVNLRNGLKDYGKNHRIDAESLLNVSLAVVPLAAYRSLNFSTQQENIIALLAALSSHPLPEVREQADRIQKFILSQAFDLASQTDTLENVQPEPVGTTIAKLAGDRMAKYLSNEAPDFKLLNVDPRNELELVSILQHTESDKMNAGSNRFDSWPYERKRKSLDKLLKNNARVTLEKISYHFESNISRIALNMLVNENIVTDFSTELASTGLGYDVPKVIEDAGLEQLYNSCFDESFALFSHLQKFGREEYGGYATLMGHNLRCKFTIRADRLITESTDVSNGLEETLKALRLCVAEVHPLIFECLENQQRRQADEPASKSKTYRRRDNIKRSKKR